jgi:hypothetical protein
VSLASSKATLIGISLPTPVHPKEGAAATTGMDERPSPAATKPSTPQALKSTPPAAGVSGFSTAAAPSTVLTNGVDAPSAPQPEARSNPSADAESGEPARPPDTPNQLATTQRLGRAPKYSTEPVARSTAPSTDDTGLRPSRATLGMLLVAALIAVGILGSRFLLQKGDVPAPAAALRDEARPVTPPAEPARENTTITSPGAPATATPSPATSAAAAPPSASATAASTAPAPPASIDGKPLPPLAEGMTRVIVKLSPPKARLFRKGKPVGSSPVVIDLAPGERRAYEVGMPGWATRKLVVDGTKPEIFIGLKPETP